LSTLRAHHIAPHVGKGGLRRGDQGERNQYGVVPVHTGNEHPLPITPGVGPGEVGFEGAAEAPRFRDEPDIEALQRDHEPLARRLRQSDP
jgi:hypothetical protein